MGTIKEIRKNKKYKWIVRLIFVLLIAGAACYYFFGQDPTAVGEVIEVQNDVAVESSPSENPAGHFRLGYVPEGYEVVSYEEHPNAFVTTYRNQEGKFLQLQETELVPGIRYDNEIEGDAVASESPGGTGKIWQIDNYLLSIYTNDPELDLDLIVENIEN